MSATDQHGTARGAAGPPDESFFEALIVTSPMVVLRLDPDEPILHYLSPNADTALGWDFHAMTRVGASLLDAVHPDDAARVGRALADMPRDDLESRTTIWFRSPRDGVDRWIHGRIRVDPAGSGDRVGFLLDVHDRFEADAEAQRERALFQGVLDHTGASIQVKDLEGRFLIANRRIAEDLGVEPASLTGRSGHDVWPAEEADAYAVNDRAALDAGKPISIEETAEHPDGTHTFVSVKFPLYDGRGEAFAVGGISTDITERTRMEAELRETEQQARSARAEAERANHAKSEFLSRMSHELRTPLNSILGFAQLLELDDLTEPQVEAVTQILKGGRHLLDLIDEILDLSRIESGRMALSLEPVALDTMIRECLELVAPQARARRITLVNEDGQHRHVRADRQRLKQVLLNLLSNAVKFNREGGTVALGCRHEPDRAVIYVRDTGAGIRPELVDRLFTPFDRLEADEQGIQGTGLGLTLSQRLVDAMGGRLEVITAPGEGAEFWFALPVGEQEGDADARDADEGEGGGDGDGSEPTATVLYVEDNVANLRLVEQVLRRRPEVRLVTALQGSLGLELAGQLRPDLILLDVHLPDLAGDVVVQRLRADPVTAPIPVVIVSADATRRQVDRFLRLGADDYLTKPLDVHRFLALIDAKLGLSSPQ